MRVAYNHAQYLAERAELMQWWANRLDALRAMGRDTGKPGDRRLRLRGKLISMQQLGLGVYTLPDAGRLVGASPASIKRWLFGYKYSKPSRARKDYESEPLWLPQYAQHDLGERVIGFHDLLEIRIVREFIARGVPLLVVRHCLDTAREIFKGDYPLTRRRFLTDGATIFDEATKGPDGESGLLDLRKRQFVFRTIIKDSLYAGIEYDGNNARRWYPEGKSHAVVVDPEIQFGHPIIERTGVPTRALYAAWLAEGKKRALVARQYQVEPRDVDTAVRYEEKLRKAA